MAVAFASFDADSPARESLKRDTRPPKNRSAEAHAVKAGIRTLVGFWECLTSSHASERSGKSWTKAEGGNGNVTEQDVGANAKVFPRELYRPYRAADRVVTSPPSYEESAQDVPPDYTVSMDVEG